MLHITLLTLSTDQRNLVRVLKNLGALHIETIDGSDKSSEDINTELTKISNCSSWLNDIQEKHNHFRNYWSGYQLECSELIELLESHKLQLDRFRKHSKEALFWDQWGEVDLERISALSRKGYFLRLFKGKIKEFEEFIFPDDVLVQKIKEEEGYYRFVILGKELNVNLPFEERFFPQRCAKDTYDLLEDSRKKLENFEKRILEIESPEEILLNRRKELQLEIDSIAVNESFTHLKSTPVKKLSAWFPENRGEDIRRELTNLRCGFKIREPQIDEKIPILLQNNSYNRIFESITKIFQLPSYFEFDLTPFIAVFYPILFAYCLGDAGYGALLILISTLYWFRSKDWSNSMLGLILGFSTSVMGLIKSGSLFGIPLNSKSDLEWARSLGEVVIIPDDTTYTWNAFNVALVIGLIQIFVGLFLSIIKALYYKGFIHSLSHIGKFSIVLGSVGLFLIGNIEESPALSGTIFKIALIMGLLLVALFHDLKLKIVPRMASSILPLFFIFTGLLGDVLSYVRLFALGVASAVLGLVVNQIGGQMWGDTILMSILSILFLLLGHSLNFGLAALGSFVHPLRLTFVEFYNNAQFEGGGLPFKAFGQSTDNQN